MSKSACRLPHIPFYRVIFKTKKGSDAKFQTTFFVEFFDKNFPFEVLQKLTKFHSQTVLTSKVIQENVFLALCLNI